MVEIHYLDELQDISLDIELESWLKSICISEQKELIEINIIYCSDQTILEKNKEILNHDYYTDIITLDYCVDNQVIGDLFISVDRVKENADNQKTTFKDELSRVISHGVLHLCGYGDKSPLEIKEMRGKEDFYLSLRT